MWTQSTQCLQPLDEKTYSDLLMDSLDKRNQLLDRPCLACDSGAPVKAYVDIPNRNNPYGQVFHLNRNSHLVLFLISQLGGVPKDFVIRGKRVDGRRYVFYRNEKTVMIDM